MTRENIVQMSAKSGIALYGMGKDREKFINYLEEFAKLVAQNEREACAKVCDDWSAWHGDTKIISKAIRAKGQA
jgi:hypothetical protein